MPSAGGERRTLIASCVANMVEWYDFAVFGALAPVLATVLLPPTAGEEAVASIFAVFATSFLARPIGALVAGIRADQRGRRRVLVAMLLLMAGATGAIGILPPWSAVGVVAPVSLVMLRLLQGFSSGGQLATSITFLTEFAPDRRRGWYGGWHTATVALGLGAGLSAGAMAASALSPAELEDWGWRVPFLVAVPLGVVALYIQLRLTESPAFVRKSAEPVTTRHLSTTWRHHRSTVTAGFALVAVLSGGFNLWFVFLPTQLASRGMQPLSVSLACGLAGLMTAAATAPVAGRLSDHVDRRPVLMVALIALCALPLPMYALAASGSVIALLIADIAIAVALAGLVLPAYLSERFPASVRATSLGLTFGLATALVGGTAPLVAAAFDSHGVPHAAPLYLTALAMVGLIAMIKAPRTRMAPSQVRSVRP